MPFRWASTTGLCHKERHKNGTIFAVRCASSRASETQKRTAALLKDNSTSYAVSCVPFWVTGHIVSLGMDNYRGSAIAEDGVAIGTQRHTWGEHRCPCGALRRDHEVAHISSVWPFGIFQPVLLSLWIEMRSGRLETRPLTLRVLVDVERMFSLSQIYSPA